jgi:hypothetical protein
MRASIVTPREPSVDIVRIFSEGTYTSFPQALKEFISNSFDAAATTVALKFDEEFGNLTIRDDGVGMSKEDFVDVFASIGRSGKSVAALKKSRVPKRKRIGRFGIGALAIVGTAERFTVRSVREGASAGFEASVDLKELAKSYHKDKDLNTCWQFAMNEWDGESLSTHFTEVTLEGIRTDIRQNLQREGKVLSEYTVSVTELSGVEELRWQLGLISPVAYAKDYPIPEEDLDKAKDMPLRALCDALRSNRFSISVNGLPVVNQAFLPSYDPKKLVKAKEARLLKKRGVGYQVRYIQSSSDSSVTYRGYICVQASQVFPEEARGILVRLRGVAVGWYRTVHFSASTTALLNSMSGEIWVDGLDEALQFDRESFREDHPLFVWFKRRIQDEIDTETGDFRRRSTKRLKQLREGALDGLTEGGARKKRDGKKIDQKERFPYLPEDIAETMPHYIERLVPQVNGTFENDWYEASAMILRKFVEILIIELYVRRGAHADIVEPTTNEYLMLKPLIDKLTGDPRFGIPARVIAGLKNVKELGDIAAHDFKIRVRKSDLEKIQNSTRVAIERLIFVVGSSAPTR